MIAEAREIQESETYRRDRINNIDFVSFGYFAYLYTWNYFSFFVVFHLR